MSNNTQPLAKVGEFFKKSGSLGLIAVVVIFGVVLLLLPSERGKKEEAAAPLAPPEAAAGAAEDFEERIASALSKIEGAGRVTVVLALHSDGEVHFATDRGYSEKTDSREQSEETVVVNSGSSVQTPVVAR
ncbi:MAG: hypothetical protein GX823_03380, partial [Clostridiales bacterium]|nr:hypothetical protein [Clostridiales bacterium]